MRVTEDDVRSAYNRGARDADRLAEALSLSVRQATRWITKLTSPEGRRASTSAEQQEIMTRLLLDKVPDKWVAETAGVSRHVVTNWKQDMGLTGLEDNGEWAAMLREIKKDPKLMRLHEEFSPH